MFIDGNKEIIRKRARLGFLESIESTYLEIECPEVKTNKQKDRD